MGYRQDTGFWGERLAGDFLRSRGWKIIEQNWRCPQGEIDLIACERGNPVVVEVKTRTSEDYGHPLEALTEEKICRLDGLARAWARSSGVSIDTVRIDVVGVLILATGVEIEHCRGIDS